MQQGVIFTNDYKGPKENKDELKEKIRKLEKEMRVLHSQALGEEPQIVGDEEAKKEKEKSKQEDTTKVENLVKEADKVLAQAKSIFPSLFYLDQITVDMTKVTIINKRFLEPKSPASIPISDIAATTYFNAYFFASIVITDNQKNKYYLKYLSTSKAAEVQKVIDGLVISFKSKVNLTSLTDQKTSDLKNKFAKIGE